jgi:hypothetical protein
MGFDMAHFWGPFRRVSDDPNGAKRATWGTQDLALGRRPDEGCTWPPPGAVLGVVPGDAGLVAQQSAPSPPQLHAPLPHLPSASFELREDELFNEDGKELLHDGADVISSPWADEPSNEKLGERIKEHGPEKRSTNREHSDNRDNRIGHPNERFEVVRPDAQALLSAVLGIREGKGSRRGGVVQPQALGGAPNKSGTSLA